MADYLTDEEQAERLKRWWDKNGTSLVIGLVLAIAAVVGWRYYQDYTADRATGASAAFNAYIEARAASESVDDYLSALDNDFTGSAYHVFSLLYRAADEVALQDWEEALALLDRAAELADVEPLRDLAHYRAAKVLYQLDRLDDSAAELAKIRSVGLAAQVAELSGDVAAARGDTTAAREAYDAALAAARRDPGAVFPGVELIELKLNSLVDSKE